MSSKTTEAEAPDTATTSSPSFAETEAPLGTTTTAEMTMSTKHSPCSSTSSDAVTVVKSNVFTKVPDEDNMNDSSRSTRAGRSVNDYENEEELRKALTLCSVSDEECSLGSQPETATCISSCKGSCNCIPRRANKKRRTRDVISQSDDSNSSLEKVLTVASTNIDSRVCIGAPSASPLQQQQQQEEQHGVDWLLPVPDEEAEEQTVDNELHRLLTLKSYLVLDAEREEAFDRLTKEASQHFEVPICSISLVDLGRQFALSSSGSGVSDNDPRETPRRVAFCAHTILSKKGICIVADTKQDARFCNNKLVTGAPFLRFYAGVPLVSPEGYKLGTFCVEGPEPRPGGLAPEEQEKLREYAAKTIELMVQRRRVLQERLNRPILHPIDDFRRHAAVVTNLGSILYKVGECVTAMRLFQEGVQTLMFVEEENSQGSLPSKERREEFSKILAELSVENGPGEDEHLALLEKVKALCAPPPGPVTQGLASANPGESTLSIVGICRGCVVDGIPGLFGLTSKLKGAVELRRNAPAGLTFAEAFQINMAYSTHADPVKHSPEEKQFNIPIDECSKATLFNMGLIHYHWGSPESAMQFFDLAASLSNQQHDPLAFDPVVLGCLNNMAQIHLQYGRPTDAMELLSDALTRGNAALARMYESMNDHSHHAVAGPRHRSRGPAGAVITAEPEDFGQQVADSKRTRRLRRKLARTVMNMGHVHFFNCDYEASLATCRDAMRLLHTNMEDMEAAAVWHNMALLHHHQGKRMEALEYLEKFLDRARVLLAEGRISDPSTEGPMKQFTPPPSEKPHVQLADALHRKGMILFEMGHLYECMPPLNEALRIRLLNYGYQHGSVAESLCLIGKVLQDREEYDFALNAMRQGLSVQRLLSGPEGQLSFDSAQTLLDVGRALHIQGRLKESLNVYSEVLGMTRKFFGGRHPFVARLDKIVGNLHLECGDVAEAIELFTESMHIHVEHGLAIDYCVVTDRLCLVKLPPHGLIAGAA